jgi:hypothetical protein
MFFARPYFHRPRRATRRAYATNGTLALLVFLGGVGSPSSAMATIPAFHAGRSSMPSRSTPGNASKPLLFVSNGVDRVSILRQGGKNKQVGQITGLSSPAGVTTDAAEDLYVTDSTASPTVPVYAPPYNAGPFLTLSTLQGYLPYSVAVSRKGLVAVAITCIDGSCSPESFVQFFAQSATIACATISLVNSQYVPYYVAFDRAGNLFVVGQSGSGPYMAEISGGCGATAAMPLAAGNENSLGRLSAVEVNRNDQVAVLDGDHGYLYTYNHPKNGSFGNPVYTTAGLDGAVDFAFTASGRDLFAIINLASVSELDYPSGALDKAFNLPSGGGQRLAVAPALIP